MKLGNIKIKSDTTPTKNKKTFLWLGILLLLLSVDFFPNFPTASLDSSWMNGMEVALGAGSVPGRDLLFTYGPLASMVTGYLGSIPFLAIALSLAIAACLGVMLASTLGKKFFFCAVLICVFSQNNEILFYLYFAIIPLAVSKFIDAAPAERSRAELAALGLSLILAPSLILSKLSFAPVIFSLTALTAIYFAVRRNLRIAVLIPVMVSASLVFWWLVSGQKIQDLSSYLTNVEIIKGYTPAMEWNIEIKAFGLNIQLFETLILYAICGWLIFLLISNGKKDVRRRVYLGLCLAAVLSVAVKAAVVRHGGVHSLIPWILLMMLAFQVMQARPEVYFNRLILAATIVGTLFFSIPYSGDGSGLSRVILNAKTYATHEGKDWASQKSNSKFWIGFVKEDFANFFDALPNPLAGLAERVSNVSDLVRFITSGGKSFQAGLEKSRDEINKACHISNVIGSVDIYPNEINCITSRDLKWQPRTVFQSYSAYTPELMKLNRQHLEGQSAPDHIFFDVLPIDNRLPSLEDGLSWHCIASRYDLVDDGIDSSNEERSFLHLKRRTNVSSCPGEQYQEVLVAGRLGQPIKLSCDDTQTHARFDFSPNAAGKIASMFYKTRRLAVDLTTCDGRKISYRFVPLMAIERLLLSPVIASREDFRRFYFDANSERANRIEQFVIRYDDSESPIEGWKPDFRVWFSR